MRSILIYPITFYQEYLSPLFPPACIYQPTCSNYMIEAIEKHGLKGAVMGTARICRCHPFAQAGEDKVPEHFSLKRNRTD